MARTVRNAKIDTRSARSKLKVRREPYWTVLGPGCAVGYRKGTKGGRWIARLRDSDEHQHYKSLGGADDAMDADGSAILSYAQAQAAARAWFNAERDVEPSGPFAIGDVMRDYLDWLADHRKASTAREFRYMARAHILPALGQIQLADLTAARLSKWHRALAKSPARLRTRPGAEPRYRDSPDDPEAIRARRATANRILTVLKAALNRAFEDGKVPSEEAWRRVKPFRGADAARVRYLQEDECRRLLNTCPDDFRRLVRAALLTGCRYGELCRLEVRDFNRDAGTLLVRESKGGKPRWVWLDDEAVAFLATITAGRPGSERTFVRADGEAWGKSHQARPLLEACQAARIDPPASFHILRHTWASHRVMRGMPLLAIAQVLGHADTRMVERHYGHLAPSYVRDAVRATAMDLGPREPEPVVPLQPVSS